MLQFIYSFRAGLKQPVKLSIYIFLLLSFSAEAQYNTLWIPDTLSGTTFNLTVKDTFRQLLPGQQTVVGTINNQRTWGPTLIWNKGDSIILNVTNSLQDTTTLHWHGIHLPAVMDGGPHQTIPPGAAWHPSFRLKNNAATYWYHPHLHMMTFEQLVMGIGGLIIVRDSAEAALNLPRRYGVDDIPLILRDVRFDASNQLVLSSYGDTMMANFTLNAQYNIPAQVIRLRILNTCPERFYNLGFSDNRTFYVIGSDGGLLNVPVALTRKLVAPGERFEILINCTGQSGQNFELKVFNSALATDIPGWQPVNYANAQFRNDLGRRDFTVLRFDVVAQTANAVTAIPSSLVNNNFPNAATATVTRTFTMTNGGADCPSYAPGCFLLNSTPFDMNRIDNRPMLNTTEIWEFTNTSSLSHPFHIHDAQFNVITVNGNSPPAADRGWKDVIIIRKNATVQFAVKFTDYADTLHPYMYHCHMAPHEDDGMMGQFVIRPDCSPVITSFQPLTLSSGALATINGKQLLNATSVNFNSVSSIYNILSDSVITATVPAAATSGLINIANSCGTAASSNYSLVSNASFSVQFFLQGLYISGGQMSSSAGTAADSATIRLYTPGDVNNYAYSIKTTVSTSGNLICTIPGSFIGRKYWICIRQRNSVETWSRSPVTITHGGLYSFKN
jgi:blue copper oxidase